MGKSSENRRKLERERERERERIKPGGLYYNFFGFARAFVSFFVILFGVVSPNVVCAKQGTGNFSVILNTGSGSGTYRFQFSLTGIGSYRVDCGTGGTLNVTNTQSGTITKTTDGTQNIRCTYTKSTTNRTITFVGTQTNVTRYHATQSVLRFLTPTTIVGFSGSVGKVFPTIDGGLTNGEPDSTKQPSFERMFTSASDNSAANMTGTIPSDFFDGVEGLAKSNMFDGTFAGCTSLTGEIPAGLFSGITGIVAGATDVFKETFSGATGLGTGSGIHYIAPQLFSGLYSENPSTVVSNMTNIFDNTGLVTSCPSGTTQFVTGFESAWNSKVSCSDGSYWIPKFFVTTTNESAGFDFSWNLAAKGTFNVDCGDSNAVLVYPDNSTSIGGGTITRTNTTSQTYKCRYSTGGSRTILFGGTATSYDASTNTDSVTISFANNLYVAGISGSLGSIFPTIITGTVVDDYPNFFRTFYGCRNLNGNIPATLFNGVTGARINMFKETFLGCFGLSGAIPANLFSGITGAESGLFYGTFSGCSGLTGSVPAGLFGGVSGAATQLFRETFANCQGLSGALPDALFEGITSAATEMFYQTFVTCSGLGLENGVPTYYIPPKLAPNLQGTATNMFYMTFYKTGFLTCCPVNMRRITSADTAISNIANYVDDFNNSSYGKVSCTVGNPAPGEETLINSVCRKNCGKVLKTEIGDTYHLFTTKITANSLGFQSSSMNNGAACYVPLSVGNNGKRGLKVSDGTMTYSVMTLSDLGQ